MKPNGYIFIGQIGLGNLSEEEKQDFIAYANKELAAKGTVKPVTKGETSNKDLWSVAGDAATTIVILQAIGVDITVRNLFDLAKTWLKNHNKDDSQMAMLEKLVDLYGQPATDTSTDKGEVLRISKIEAARREINAAIRMYFIDEDPVAIHAVLAGGMQIVSDLGARQGKPLGFEMGMHLIREERREELRKIFREPQNHFKHADAPGDDNKVIEYRPAVVEMYLLMAGMSYRELTGMDTPETRAIAAWVSLRNPNLLGASWHKTLSEDYVKQYGTLTDADKPTMSKFITKIRTEKKAAGVDFS